jgi:hypothetical protein
MRKVLLFAFLFLLGKKSDAQMITPHNNTNCDLVVTFQALDTVTCTVLNTSTTFYVIPAVPTPPFFTIAWSAPFTQNFILVATVSWATCPGGPSVIVGGPPCASPAAMLPAGCGCGPAMVSFPVGIIDYKSLGSLAFPLDAN